MIQPSQEQLHQAIGPFFMPLGGAGEIGANFYLYGSAGYWIAIDCGMGFLKNGLADTTILLPDVNLLEDNGITIQALLITHSHEDHIGALPWLWRQLACPVYASPFAAEMILSRVKPEQQGGKLHRIRPLRCYEFGPFTVEWIPVTHSIPESHGIHLQVAGRSLYHTGDWKLDPAPVIGERTAVSRLQALGQEGIDLVIGDSTNATRDGHSRSELAVQLGLMEQIRKHPGRVLVTCFASNLARMASLGIIARHTGRHLTLLGRSMQRVRSIGARLGYLEDFPPLIPSVDLGYLPSHEQLLICTGSQGEPGAALFRLANASHPDLELEAGDLVIFSSKTIPGNEAAVEGLVQKLRERGILLVTDGDACVHASGHPSQDELRQLYSWLKPTCLLAMHGEPHHEEAHVQLARELGMQARAAWNGELYDLSSIPRKVAALPAALQPAPQPEKSRGITAS
ncbi:ribonuclease J [Marinospirillum alkaliphilum]|uniref:Ribonuclease J n=1 Tax=Marinospirillum alkaliphilum DSM 21637 TaxID=1122209 RepID=A0A1K1XK73_9GAMM|nr:ribonuclease J [Marinospirillum alkaliphilum]SFX49991.1 ribonuclease J [Marinospirillum alkaliphilum DSM 21637]